VNLLVDTHIFLWWEWRSRDLPQIARAALGNRGNQAVVSAATIREISIKRQTGRLDFEGDLIAACDPFDRMLVAQAELEGLVLLTQDRKLLPYGVPILGVT
jgi:PIN domain nuclease of toxin-antitoxin system